MAQSNHKFLVGDMTSRVEVCPLESKGLDLSLVSVPVLKVHFLCSDSIVLQEIPLTVPVVMQILKILVVC